MFVFSVRRPMQQSPSCVWNVITHNQRCCLFSWLLLMPFHYSLVLFSPKTLFNQWLDAFHPISNGTFQNKLSNNTNTNKMKTFYLWPSILRQSQGAAMVERVSRRINIFSLSPVIPLGHQFPGWCAEWMCPLWVLQTRRVRNSLSLDLPELTVGNTRVQRFIRASQRSLVLHVCLRRKKA